MRTNLYYCENENLQYNFENKTNFIWDDLMENMSNFKEIMKNEWDLKWKFWLKVPQFPIMKLYVNFLTDKKDIGQC